MAPLLAKTSIILFFNAFLLLEDDSRVLMDRLFCALSRFSLKAGDIIECRKKPLARRRKWIKSFPIIYNQMTISVVFFTLLAMSRPSIG